MAPRSSRRSPHPVFGEDHPARHLDGLRPVRRSAPGRPAVGAARGGGQRRRRGACAAPGHRRRSATRPVPRRHAAARRVLRRARPRSALDRSAPAAPWPTPRTPPARISHSAGRWSRPATFGRPSSRIGARWRWTPVPATRAQQIRWTEDRLAARAHPVTVSRRTLESYAGQYQERTITVRDGRLYYRRGASPESRLIPMARRSVRGRGGSDASHPFRQGWRRSRHRS